MAGGYRMNTINQPGSWIRRRGIIVLQVVLALVVLYTLSHVVVPLFADEVTITVQSYSSEQGLRTAKDVYHETLRDAATVSRLEVIFASARRYAPWTHFNCPTPLRINLAYTFHFRWHGILLQEVRIPNDTCVSMAVTTLGMRDPIVSGGPTMGQWQEIHTMTGVPILAVYGG